MSKTAKVVRIRKPETSPSHVLVAKIESLSPLTILLADARRSTACRSTITLHARDLGKAVVVAFEDGDRERPIITGLLLNDPVGAPSVEAHIDGERVVLEGKKEIVLSCGQASITLTAEGRVIIKGSYVLTRSSGQNKIKGATVHIN